MNYRFILTRPSKLTPRLKRCGFVTFLIAIFIIPVFSTPDIQQAGPDDPKRLVKQADKLLSRGDLTGAEALLKRAVDARSVNSTPKLKLAFVYVKQRRLVEAYELAAAVLKAEPKNSYAFAILGATYLSAGRFKDARIFCVNAIKIDRREALAWAGLGMLDFYENEIGESLNNLVEAVYHDPDQADYLYALAQVSARAEKYKEAAQAYEDFLRVSRNADDERRARIRGLINFLKFLGSRSSLYQTAGAENTQVPFELVGNRPIIKLRVNGRSEELNFVLDTGSGISVISDETAKALNIKSITKGGFAKGIGGDGKFEIVYGFLREVDIGDVAVKSVPVYIRKFHSDGKIDGYIGLSLISKFLTTIDYGTQTFGLQKKDSIVDAAFNAEGMSLPLRLTSSGFLSGEVQLEGIEAPLNFIVDTGASVSVISDDIATHTSMVPHVRSERMRVIGSAGITEDVPSFLLPKISFGAHSRKSITAIALDLDLINEASGFEQAGILGGNFLKNYRMTFDFKNSKVTFVLINREVEK
ncbi:MAG TPA: aspartyl protease family protein [Pyrinomonadaceae bacterium]|nr:aspartyl protease family protein [Pyrinomonadaceae bacterium]